MIVFVEGADGSGKSTLVSQLKYHYPTLTITRESQSKYKSIWSGFNYASSGKVFVADRCFISDYVYRLHDLAKGDYNMMEMLRLLKGNAVIYCKTDTQFEDSLLRGEDNITNKDDAEDIRNLYDVMMRILLKEGIPVMCYDWKTQSLSSALSFIKELEGGKDSDTASV